MKPPGRVAWLVAAGVVLGILLQFVRELPPSMLTGIATAASGGAVELQAPEGGLFAGSGRVLLVRSGARLDLGRWSWSGTWSGAGPGWRLVAESGPLHGQLDLSPASDGVSLTDVHLQIPAQAVPPGFASWDLLHAGGMLDLASPALRIDEQGITGKGTLQWRNASTTLVLVAPLGSWSSDFDARGIEGDYRLATLDGPLHIEGRGRFALDGRLALDGRAWPDASQAEALNPVLGLLGTPREDGSVTLALPWPPAR